jgi:hypothetical protein
VLTLFQIALVVWVVVNPIVTWRALGDPDHIAQLSEPAQRFLGVKWTTGTNGKTYLEPPPAHKRLQYSLLWGFIWTLICAFICLAAGRFIDFSA